MKRFKILFLVLAFIGVQNLPAQTEIEHITKTLMDYIEGTANGEPDRVKSAFHKNLNLYHIKNDSLVTWSGSKYSNNIEVGRKNDRKGRIVSIDYENDAAIAKIEIDIPSWERIYTDYLLLLKVENQWKIIHKSFTYISYPNTKQ